MAGKCGGIYGLVHEFKYTFVDDTFAASVAKGFQPWKWGDPTFRAKAQRVADKLGIKVADIDLTDEEIETFFRNAPKGYAHQIDAVSQLFFDTL